MKKNSMTKIAIVLMSLVVSLVLISCEKTSTDPEANLFDIQGENGFVGTVDETDAFIALLVAEEEAIVYVCNGEEEISEWFRGDISDPYNISLANDAGAQVTAKFEGNVLSGQVSLLSMDSHSFEATPSNAEGAGVFRVMGDEAAQDGLEAGWIQNSAGDERGSIFFNFKFQKKTGIKIRDIKDGTSNTLLFAEKSYPIFRFSLMPSSSAGYDSITVPNNIFAPKN
jgi:hypothetical protein